MKGSGWDLKIQDSDGFRDKAIEFSNYLVLLLGVLWIIAPLSPRVRRVNQQHLIFTTGGWPDYLVNWKCWVLLMGRRIVSGRAG